MLDSESITEGLTATLVYFPTSCDASVCSVHALQEIPAIPLLNGSSLALHQYARSGAEGPERAVTTAEVCLQLLPHIVFYPHPSRNIAGLAEA